MLVSKEEYDFILSLGDDKTPPNRVLRQAARRFYANYGKKCYTAFILNKMSKIYKELRKLVKKVKEWL